jgi:hypothetical protein
MSAAVPAGIRNWAPAFEVTTMTKAKDRTESAKDQESKAGSKRPDDGQELDAEIVRDLEVDEQANDVRGGPCPASTKAGWGQ